MDDYKNLTRILAIAFVLGLCEIAGIVWLAYKIIMWIL
jgi:hypothetical protein